MMTKGQIIRAWKDETYRAGLTACEAADLPLNPAGAVELTESDLSQAAGGEDEGGTCVCASLGCCKGGLITWFFSCNGGCVDNNPTLDYACK